MCKRICAARKKLIIVAKSVDNVAGILCELLFENVNYLYLMLKRIIIKTSFHLFNCKVV